MSPNTELQKALSIHAKKSFNFSLKINPLKFTEKDSCYLEEQITRYKDINVT